MSKVITLAVAVLLVAVPAFAVLPPLPVTPMGIGQAQNFQTVALNGVQLLGGSQSMNSSNFATVVNNQNAVGQCNLIAGQNQLAFFNQAANANGLCAQIGVTQSIGNALFPASGVQVQLIGGGVLAKGQEQTLGVLAVQEILKTNSGDGDGHANQTASILQNQDSGNSTGPMNQSSFVFGQQCTNLVGAPQAQGLAGSTLAVSTGQTQVVY